MIGYPKNYSGYSRYYLERFFANGRYLVITDHWLVDNHTNNIDTQDYDHVIFDLTHNPSDRINYYRCREFQRKFPSTILINDYQFFYHPIDGVCWFPIFFYIWNQQDALWYRRIDFDFKDQTKTINISCLNGTPNYHRKLLADEIGAEIEKMLFTQHSDSVNQANNDVGIGHDAFQKTALNVVTETATTSGFLSEKICKPLACQQFFILLAQTKSTRFLKDLGFDIFEDLIPHREWDSDPDLDSRVKKIARFVKSNIDKDWPAVNQQYRARLEANRKHLMLDTFYNTITDQIISRCRALY